MERKPYPSEILRIMIQITDKEFHQLVGFIKDNYGINIKEEKRALLTGRLSNTLIQNGYSSFTDFYKALTSDKSEAVISQLINKITTNHTFFMREKDHFDYFKNTVLPELYTGVTNRDLRIWCAACSTGEESYTLAMLIDEFLGKKKIFWDKKILATDISEKVLHEAMKGEYANEKLKSLPLSWRMNYFKAVDDENSVVVDSIKNEVIDRKFNLMESRFPFRKKFHVIFCRNVMIYFDNNTKIDLVNKLYERTGNGGYLFLGHSEAIARNESDFRYVAPAVYRKI